MNTKNKQKEPFWRWFIKTSLLIVVILAFMMVMYDKGVNNGRFLQCQDNDLHLVTTQEGIFTCVDEGTYHAYIEKLNAENQPLILENPSRN